MTEHNKTPSENAKIITIENKMETALNGQYTLKAGDVIKEAWQLTLSNFGRFAPANAIFIAVSALIIVAFVQFLLDGDVSSIMVIFDNEAASEDVAKVAQALLIINIGYEVLIAPLTASLLLMALYHSIGGRTTLRYLLAGFYCTLPLMFMALLSMLIQSLSSFLLPLSWFLMIGFSMAPFLICERKMMPLTAMLTSLRAVTKKFLPILGIYILIIFCYIVSMTFFMGIGLIIALPFIFHLKAVVYREMFGLDMIVTEKKDDDAATNSNSFDA